MEKLIPLLNERHNLEWVLGSSRDNGDYLFVKGDKDNKFFEERIISKKFGFIKWLVENDKIETNNLSLKAFKNIFSGGGFVEVSDLEVLLMLLSISDTPIDDLISYLK